MSLHLLSQFRPVLLGTRPRPFFYGKLFHRTAEASEMNVLVDTGSTVTLFPLTLLADLGLKSADLNWKDDSGRRLAITWRGVVYPRGVAGLSIHLRDDAGHELAWRGKVSFCGAPLAYALLGDEGCLEFFDAIFRFRQGEVELIPNEWFRAASIQVSG